jgi:hypothetical protein
MKTLLTALGACLLSACDSEVDATDGGVRSPFLGTWTGNSYASVLGAPATVGPSFGPAPDLVIGAGSQNEFVLGICPLDDRPSVPATLTDSTHLALAEHSCPQIHFGQDCVITPVISSGTGNLRGPLLTVSVVGHLELCDGGTQDYFDDFTGAK